jgi:hypothetical protein
MRSFDILGSKINHNNVVRTELYSLLILNPVSIQPRQWYELWVSTLSEVRLKYVLKPVFMYKKSTNK